MLHAKTHNRIRMIPTDPETGPVERADIVKGYEVDKDRYVVVTDDEIDGGAAGEHPHHRHRALRRGGRGRPALLGRALLSGPRRQAGAGGLCGDPRGDAAHGAHRAGPRGDAHPRAPAGHRAARRAASSPTPCARRTRCAIRPRPSTTSRPKRPTPPWSRSPRRSSPSRIRPLRPRQFTDRYEDALRALIAEKEKGAGAGRPPNRRKTPRSST